MGLTYPEADRGLMANSVRPAPTLQPNLPNGEVELRDDPGLLDNEGSSLFP